jgi:Peptidase family M48
VVSALLAAFAVAVPASVIGHGLAAFFEACKELISDGAAWSSVNGRLAVAAAGILVARIAFTGAAMLLRTSRQRRRHAQMLMLIGRHDGDLGAVVVDYDERLVYCLPGRNGQAVITAGALRCLAPEQVAAVLAHERAHLCGRHHLLLAGAEILDRALPGVPIFRRARVGIARLVELLADDVAARRHPRIEIAAALVRLATGRVPAFALGAGGEAALTRVRRMLHPEAPLCRRKRLAGVLAVGLLLAGPVAVAAIPGVVVLVAHHCHSIFA